jgi:hypothetical protein
VGAGQVDVPLADTGVAEADRAAANLKEEGFTFDIMCAKRFPSRPILPPSVPFPPIFPPRCAVSPRYSP